MSSRHRTPSGERVLDWATTPRQSNVQASKRRDSMLRYRLISLLLAFAGCLCTTQGALAADNERITGVASFIAHHLCIDPIRVESSYDEMMHTYYDNGGNAIRLQF